MSEPQPVSATTTSHRFMGRYVTLPSQGQPVRRLQPTGRRGRHRV
jgi:hypothetical protein